MVKVKKKINMLEHMEISEPIYQNVVDNSTKILTRADSNCSGNSSKMRGE